LRDGATHVVVHGVLLPHGVGEVRRANHGALRTIAAPHRAVAGDAVLLPAGEDHVRNSVFFEGGALLARVHLAGAGGRLVVVILGAPLPQPLLAAVAGGGDGRQGGERHERAPACSPRGARHGRAHTTPGARSVVCVANLAAGGYSNRPVAVE